MRAVQVAQGGGALELVEREMPEPAQGEVRVRVEACGVCHSDSLTVEGQWPGLSFPRIPGHEIAGIIDAVGTGVVGWAAGQRVGVGWFGGHCGHCERCRRGCVIDCRNLLIPGISYDGGYADAMVAPADALAAMPDQLSAVDAARSAPASQPSMRSATAEQCRVTSSRCWVSAASAISECSSQTSSAFAPWRSPAAPIRRRCRAT